MVNIPFPLNSSNEIENVYEKKMQELNEKYQKKAEKKVNEMCKKLLVNLIIEDYSINRVQWSPL